MQLPSPTPENETTPKTFADKHWGLIIVALVLLTAVLPLGYFIIWPSYVNSQLLKYGLQAEGTIVDIEPTGNYINEQPQARITVDVRPTDGKPFRAETKMIINALYAPMYQPGRPVRVRYDKDDHSKMTIEYTAGF